MAEVIRMPKMSDTMEEGVLAQWLKKEGDEIKSGDIIAEVETDKATMELESYEDGILLHLGVKNGEAVPVNGVLAIIGEKGENIDDLLKEISETKGKVTPSDASEEPQKEEAASSEEAIDTSGIQASLITMPKMSDTMTEGTIASWLKKEGDEIKSGDVLAEVETDKATMELESYEDGILLYIGPKAGESVPVDGVLAVIGEKGADFNKLLIAHEAKSKTPEVQTAGETKAAESVSQVSAAIQTQAPTPSAETHTSGSNGRIKVSPLAKKLAGEKGYDISLIKGTGDGGRIVKRDVEAFVP